MRALTSLFMRHVNAVFYCSLPPIAGLSRFLLAQALGRA